MFGFIAKDRVKAEVLLRMGAAFVLGLGLSVATIPNAIPVSEASLVGILVPTLSIAFPTLAFILAGIFPSIIVAMVVSLWIFTMLLFAATVSEGLMVALFSVLTLLISSLYFGGKSNPGLTGVLIVMPALLTLALQPFTGSSTDRVKLLWTEHGLDNALAANRNILIAICWILFCLAVPILLPPIRTVRRTLSRAVLPAIYLQIAALLEGQEAEDKQAAQDKLVHLWNSLGGGSKAKLTLFEPRVWRLENLVPLLANLLEQTDLMILSAFIASIWSTDTDERSSSTDVDDAAQLLKACAKALESNQPEDMQVLDDWKDMDDLGDTTWDGVAAHYILKHSILVKDATVVWLHAINDRRPPPSSKVGRIELLKKIYLLWFVVPFIPYTQLAVALALPFRPSKWSLAPFVWALKYTAGFVALLCMTVYWPAYSSFKISTEFDPNLGPVYNGWQLLGYTYAWKPTAEGTLKKGLERSIGTVLGGFSAWLGIIVCSWSYDDDAEINPYGLVAWLTVTDLVAAYLVIDPGLGSLMGKGADHGNSGMYFVAIQSIIALEVFYGEGTKNDLTVNRIIATITGVAMAALLANIPPSVRGSDPVHVRVYWTASDDAFACLLETFADEAECRKLASDEYRKSLLLEASKSRAKALLLLNDASPLHAMPLFRPDPRMKPLLEQMAVTESLIGIFTDYVVDVVKKDLEVASARSVVQAFLKGNDDGEEEGPSSVGESPISATTLLISSTRMIRDRLNNHEKVLKQLEEAFGSNQWWQQSMV